MGSIVHAPHLLVALTAHGFGHAAMTAPVVDALAGELPGLRLTLQSNHPRQLLARRFKRPFEQISGPDDFGLKMQSATRIDVDGSAAAYRDLHDRLASAVTAQSDRMKALGVDLVLANVGYVPLLAAQKAGIPAFAMSCLNWADIYAHYFSDRPEAPAVDAAMLEAYRSARRFLCPAPAMPMPRLDNLHPIGPLAAVARTDRMATRRRLGVDAGMHLGLIAFGGVAADLPLASWPRLAGWRWLVTADPADRADQIAFDATTFDFTEVLQSCDVVVSKPGYGTFTEAAANGVPVLFVPRPDWPESPPLIDWLSEWGRCAPIEAQAMFDPTSLTETLHSLLHTGAKPRVRPTGNEEAANILSAALRQV
jgi:hypothetical protein